MKTSDEYTEGEPILITNPFWFGYKLYRTMGRSIPSAFYHAIKLELTMYVG